MSNSFDVDLAMILAVWGAETIRILKVYRILHLKSMHEGAVQSSSIRVCSRQGPLYSNRCVTKPDGWRPRVPRLPVGCLTQASADSQTAAGARRAQLSLRHGSMRGKGGPTRNAHDLSGLRQASHRPSSIWFCPRRAPPDLKRLYANRCATKPDAPGSRLPVGCLLPLSLETSRGVAEGSPNRLNLKFVEKWSPSGRATI